MRKRPSSQTSIKSFFAPVASAESCQESDSCHIAKRPKTASGAGGSISGACLEGGIPDRNPHRHAAAQRKLVGGASWSPGGEGDVGPVKGGKKYTPLEQQVMKLKKQYSGVILIIEVGYKMRLFGEDAEIASKCCNFYCYPDHNFMTTSFPVPRLPIHVRRLVENGYKVGVVRQMESAATKSTSGNKYSVFERKLVSMHTRATLDAGEVFEAGMDYGGDGVGGQGGSSQLLCVVEGEQEYGMVAVEACTGEVRYGTYRIDITDHEIWSILLRIEPQEVVTVNCEDSRMQKLVKNYISSQQGGRLESFSDSEYQEHRVVEKIAEFYGDTENTAQCELELVLSFPRLVLMALCAAKDYLAQFNVDSVLKLASTFKVLSAMQEMQLSGNALTQLEILRNSHNGGREGSLLHIMDQTRTAAGSRLLRNWLCHPLADMALIRDRHDAVEEILTNQCDTVKNIPQVLGRIPDLEKVVGRVLHKTASPSECADMLMGFQLVCQQLASGEGQPKSSTVSSPLLVSLLTSATSQELFTFTQSCLRMINLQAAKQNDSINVFADESWFRSVFEAKNAVHDAEKHLKGLLPGLAKKVGMHKLSYTTVMNQGNYLIEVPSSHKHIPANWSKVCSTKKVDRYHTPEIKSGMLALDLAQERLVSITKKAWSDFLSLIIQQYAICRSAVQALAVLDVLNSFAILALSPQYTRPKMIGEESRRELMILGGRHPILDSILEGSAVANDVQLMRDGQRAIIVTGPNMGGKSCYIKLVALTVIMAQVGSFVPADSISMHTFDAVFTRMGASDNIQMGKSTFLEELSDASTILSDASDRSLVVMDELGRGTATYDGVAIAQATLEYLVNQIQCLTCFVTHYPEVARMEDDLPGTVVAYHMSYTCLYEKNIDGDTKDQDQEIHEEQSNKGSRILFLYKLIPGAADHSFGLNVAQMAGLPQSTIHVAKARAEEAANLSSGDQNKVNTLKHILNDMRRGVNVSNIMKCLNSQQYEEDCLGDVEIDRV